MSKQDTYDKLRHGIHAGMRLEHVFRRNFRRNTLSSSHDYRNMLNPMHDWFCTISEIDEANNELKVSVTIRHGHSRPETWDMKHTVGGLNSGEYLEITGEVE